MEPTGQRETAAEIEATAAAWVARQDRGPLSDTEQKELEQWASADSRRAGAYARAMAVSLHLDRTAALGENFAARPDTVTAPARRRVMMAGAGALLACMTGFGLFTAARRENAPTSRPVATPKGEVREITLQEGSRITLNSMTQIRPELTSDQRGIILLEGEALFDVTHNPARPFIVQAGGFGVRAIGTSFTVHRTAPDAIRVVVTDGIVEVSRGETILGRVHAGVAFAVQASATPVISTLSPAQIDRALAWRGGRIDLEGMTLAQAAREFSRYSDVIIRVDDPSIGNMRITGVYATSDPAGFASDVALSLGLRAERRGNVVLLSGN